MKKLRNVIGLILILVFTVNINGFAQDAPKGVKEVKEKVSKQDAVKKKAEYTKAEQQELEGEAKNKEKEVKRYSEMSEDEMLKYKEKIKNAPPEEQKRLEAELMSKREKLKGAKKDKKEQMREAKQDMKEGMKGEKRELKESMKEEKREMKEGMKEAKREMKGEMKEAKNKGKAYGKNKGNLEGREFGQARASDAKSRIEKEEAEMADRDEYIVKSKNQIAIAKKSLQGQIEAGNISKEDIVAKQARIGRAEQRLKDYEARIIDGKQKLSTYKNNVSDIYGKN